MPRPRKTPLPVLAPMVTIAPRSIQLHTRTLLRAVSSDDRDAALEAAEGVANEHTAILEASGATILRVSAQTLCVERFTRWQVFVTIVYREAVNAVV